MYQDVNGVVTAVQASVNDTTGMTAPLFPVKEIGKVLPRLLTNMQDTTPGLHILFSKLNISDGFWRLIVREADSYNFAYVLPQEANEPCRVVVPAAVQMGWVESPSHFCVVTESARDLMQHFVDNDILLPPDPLENAMKIADVPMQGRTWSPTKLLQVYVDDFCYAATQSEWCAHSHHSESMNPRHPCHLSPHVSNKAQRWQGTNFCQEARGRRWKLHYQEGDDWVHV